MQQCQRSKERTEVRILNSQENLRIKKVRHWDDVRIVSVYNVTVRQSENVCKRDFREVYTRYKELKRDMNEIQRKAHQQSSSD